MVLLHNYTQSIAEHISFLKIFLKHQNWINEKNVYVINTSIGIFFLFAEVDSYFNCEETITFKFKTSTKFSHFCFE